MPILRWWLTFAFCVAACGDNNQVEAPSPAVLLADVRPGAESGHPSFVTPVGDLVFFTAFPDGIGPGELWRSDGTPAGTVRVRGFEDYPHNLAALGDLLLFTAGDGSSWGLWVSDGTDAGTVPLLSLQPNDTTTRAGHAVHGGRYYLAASGAGAGGEAEGRGFVVSDGTVPGTFNLDVAFRAQNLFGLGDLVFFFRNEPNGAAPPELWSTDGTPGGTLLVSEVNAHYLNVHDIAGGRAWLKGGQQQLWVTDGTAAGTLKLKDFTPRFLGAISADEEGALFVTESGGHTGNELWRSDGTVAGTTKIVDLPDGELREWQIEHHGSTALLLGDAGLWRTDGTAAGTLQLRAFALTPLEPFTHADAVLFIAGDGARGEVWNTDGTAAGTVRRFGIPGGGVSGPFAATGSHLFFPGIDDDHGDELWAAPLSAL